MHALCCRTGWVWRCDTVWLHSDAIEQLYLTGVSLWWPSWLPQCRGWECNSVCQPSATQSVTLHCCYTAVSPLWCSHCHCFPIRTFHKRNRADIFARCCGNHDITTVVEIVCMCWAKVVKSNSVCCWLGFMLHGLTEFFCVERLGKLCIVCYSKHSKACKICGHRHLGIGYVKSEKHLYQ